jgi:hypothetical protein
LAEVRAADVQGDAGDAGRRVEAAAGEFAEAEQKVKWYQARCDAAKTEEDFELFAGKAVEWERKRKELAARLADAQREAASPLAESWGEFRSLAELLDADPSDELRVRARSALRRAVEGVHCLFVSRGRSKLAAVRVQFRGGDRHRDYVFRYSPVRANKWGRKEATLEEPLSFADAGLSDTLDPRRAADVAAVARRLLTAAGAGS